MSRLKLEERDSKTIACFILEGSVDELIEYLQLKKEEGFTEFCVYDDGFAGHEDYILEFN